VLREKDFADELDPNRMHFNLLGIVRSSRIRQLNWQKAKMNTASELVVPGTMETRDRMLAADEL